jgi:multicomponent K+:H+ antiporter subunit G
MSPAVADLPPWAAILAAIFLLIAAVLSLTGAIGLVRLRSFYDRIHAPTLATSWGTGAMVMASAIVFASVSARPVLHEILIGVFVTATTPITLMLLARAALFRDRSERNPEVPTLYGPPEDDNPPES